jgi:hypothetical protein
MSSASPYLSVVVAARNDDHGGNLLGRVQTFLNAFINQMKRYNLPSELIIVDWNPPEIRPPLMDALKWPPALDPCCVRVIEVPADVHRRYRYSEVLPLYQMIAKNVGIRRARGQFILATNIDILFSDELVAYLSARQLESRRMYRIDRYDVMSDVPIDGTVDEQLAYCRNHLIRVNTREGTFRITPDGRRALESVDIAEPDAGVSFGPGWFAVESAGSEGIFRSVENNAEVFVRPSSHPLLPLIFDIEPAFGAGGKPFVLRAVTADGVELCSTVVESRTNVPVPLPAGCSTFNLLVVGGGYASPHDPRIVNFRVFRCRRGSAEQALHDEGPSAALGKSQTEPASLLKMALHPIATLQGLAARIAKGGPAVQISLPVGPLMVRVARMFAKTESAMHPEPIEPCNTVKSLPETPRPSALSPMFLHTNACGDFTLMERDQWFDLRGYPEFDAFSMNIDSVLCCAAHHAGFAEKILPDPMRIYHIEHRIGSGWTPEGQADLFTRIAAKGIPWLEYREYVVWAEQMRRFNSTMIFNRKDWGLANDGLTESTLPSSAPSRK